MNADQGSKTLPFDLIPLINVLIIVFQIGDIFDNKGFLSAVAYVHNNTT